MPEIFFLKALMMVLLKKMNLSYFKMHIFRKIPNFLMKNMEISILKT